MRCTQCRSGLVSRKGRRAAPAIFAAKLKSWGRCAPLSRHKAAPTGYRASPMGSLKVILPRQAL
ncbi:hypothetical protein GEV38_20325 [Pseudomonas sp. 13159349]|nr:hypothetical protein GEV38_20325 [Pseudomonas sp. 13159349]TXI07280.1 MAG: hypothetical protein E6Q70_05500 [Pseudomonas monteilii]